LVCSLEDITQAIERSGSADH